MTNVSALLPCYNEEKNIKKIIQELSLLNLRYILVINDGSTDSSLNILISLKKKYANLIILNFKKNVGLSQAKITGYAYYYQMFLDNIINKDHYIIKMDTDGQHRIEDAKKLIDFCILNKLKYVQTKRDFSNYPFYKKLGNIIFSILLMLIKFKYIPDPMSGMKIFNIGCIERLLMYFKGINYSAAQEISLILSSEDNTRSDFLINIPIYVVGARFSNGYYVILGMTICYFRILFNIKNNVKKRINDLIKYTDLNII